MDGWTSTQLEVLFSVSHETIRTWAGEFAQYMSPTANPGKGRHRRFSEDDISVLSLVAQMKRDGITFEEIHVALQAGERGLVPDVAKEEIAALTLHDQNHKLVLEAQLWRSRYEQAQSKLNLLGDEREQRLVAEALLRDTRERLALAEQKLEEAQKAAGDAREELGRLRALVDKGEGA